MNKRVVTTVLCVMLICFGIIALHSGCSVANPEKTFGQLKAKCEAVPSQFLDDLKRECANAVPEEVTDSFIAVTPHKARFTALTEDGIVREYEIVFADENFSMEFLYRALAGNNEQELIDVPRSFYEHDRYEGWGNPEFIPEWPLPCKAEYFIEECSFTTADDKIVVSY